MDRTKLARQVRSDLGMFPSLRQIDTYIGMRHGTAARLMEGIEPLKDGRAKRYYSGDVADRLIDAGYVKI